MTQTRLVIAGGGTGGHLYPGIAVAEALLEIEPDAKVLFVGTERGIERTAVPKAGFDLELIEVSGLKRVGLLTTLRTLVGLPLAHVASSKILKRFGATAVLGVGGYASGPVVLTARMMGIPTAICEQNSVPGLTNRILGKVVRKVFGTFGSSASYFPSSRFELVGNPVRASFRQAASQPANSPEAGLIFTFGGSQGARPLNQIVPQALGVLQAKGRTLKALHQAGIVDGPTVEEGYKAAQVEAKVVSFIDDMVSAYRHADLVICRAGATSCSELTALGVPAILIPFPQAADDHQTKNAADLVAGGAAILMPQHEMTPERLAAAIDELLSHRDQRGKMADASRALGKLNAAVDVAQAAQGHFKRQQVASLLASGAVS